MPTAAAVRVRVMDVLLGGGGWGGATDAEGRGEQHLLGGAGAARHDVEHLRDARRGGRRDRLGHAGEADGARHRGVVEAGDRQARRGAEGAERERVARADQGGRRVGTLQQPRCGVAALGHAVLDRHLQLARRRQPRGAHRGAPALAAVVAHAGAAGPAHEPDPAVPPLGQVLDRGPRAGRAVDVDEGVVLVGGAPGSPEGRERDAAVGQPPGARVTVVGAGEDEPVGLLGAEQVRVRGHLGLVVGGGEQHDAVAVALCRLDDGVQEPVEHGAVDAAAVGLEAQAEEHRAAGAHLPGSARGAVPELVDRLPHALGGVVAHEVRRVEHVRDRLAAHPGALRDRVERRPCHAHLRRCASWDWCVPVPV